MEKKKLTDVPLHQIQIKDAFWDKYIRLVKDVILPYQWNTLNDNVKDAAPSHCIKNFKIAAGEAEGDFEGAVFQDTDVAKWLEAVAFTLDSSGRDDKLEKLADETIDLIGKAQCEDGYLNTYFTIKEPDRRWTNLKEGHELYTAGHMIEAAVAYYQATGKKEFLEIVSRFADVICEKFGPKEGQCHGYPGHPEVELALVKLYRVTKEKKYLDECGPANFFGIRGNSYITPQSHSILPSITNKSLQQLAEDMGLTVERRPVPFEEIATFDEAAECGTAAVIAPISQIDDLDENKSFVIAKDGKPGPVCEKLYHKLRAIQYGDEPDTYGWISIIE